MALADKTCAGDLDGFRHLLRIANTDSALSSTVDCRYRVRDCTIRYCRRRRQCQTRLRVRVLQVPSSTVHGPRLCCFTSSAGPRSPVPPQPNHIVRLRLRLRLQRTGGGGRVLHVICRTTWPARSYTYVQERTGRAPTATTVAEALEVSSLSSFLSPCDSASPSRHRVSPFVPSSCPS